MSRTFSLIVLACILAASSQELGGQNAAAPAADPLQAIERTRQTLESYWQEHDPKFVAENAEFTMMPSGEVIRGRTAIAQHLHHFYSKAFNARAERVNAIFGVNEGLLEATVVGTHTGEFAGIPATGRTIRVPISVAYELEDGLITRARIYLMSNVLLAQLRAPGASDGSP